jgi:hypothetical protein
MCSSVSTQYTTRTNKAPFNAEKALSKLDQLTSLSYEDLTDELDVVYSKGRALERQATAAEAKGGFSKGPAT